MDTYFTVRDLDINLQIIHCYNGNGQDKSEQWSFHPSWLGWGMNNYPVIYMIWSSYYMDPYQPTSFFLRCRKWNMRYPPWNQQLAPANQWLEDVFPC